MGVIGNTVAKIKQGVYNYKQQQLNVDADIERDKELSGYNERKRETKTQKVNQRKQGRREAKETRLQNKLINKGLVDGQNYDGTYDAAGIDDGLYSDEKQILKTHRKQKIRNFFSNVKGAIKGNSSPQTSTLQSKAAKTINPTYTPEGSYTKKMEPMPAPRYKTPLERNVGMLGKESEEAPLTRRTKEERQQDRYTSLKAKGKHNKAEEYKKRKGLSDDGSKGQKAVEPYN